MVTGAWRTDSAVMLTTSQTAARLQLSADRVRQLERTKQLRAEWSPLGRLFAESDVDRLAEERRQRRSDVMTFAAAGTSDAA
jgi:hypothetical protein